MFWCAQVSILSTMLRWPGGYIVGLGPDRTTAPKAKAAQSAKVPTSGQKTPSKGRRRATEAFKGPIKKITDPRLSFNVIWVRDSNPKFPFNQLALRNYEYYLFTIFFVEVMSSWPLARTHFQYMFWVQAETPTNFDLKSGIGTTPKYIDSVGCLIYHH